MSFLKTITTDDIADGLINIGITSLTEAGIIGYGQLFADLDIGEQLKEGTKKEITILEAFVVTQAVQQKVDSKDLSKRILDKVHEKLYRRMNLSETEATEFEKTFEGEIRTLSWYLSDDVHHRKFNGYLAVRWRFD